jgi:hypothetical protein
VRGVIDAQNILIGRLPCRARRGRSYNRSLEAHQACDSTAAAPRRRARSGDTEQASARYAGRNDAALKQPAVPAALTEIVMREALILAVGCCLIMVLAAGLIAHFVP